ncbi:MAG TPA: zinc ribbon domain-containing protein [Candidatus Acidoferrales bacterium]|nr:zinc ribbon domain-containing protein [Candidatus Acidoferrales bacterium]
MPRYDYACADCGTNFEISHGMFEEPRILCPRCRCPAKRLLGAPGLNLGNCSSPSAAKYAKISPAEEIAREREQQKDYQGIWLPAQVKHNPWDGSTS